MRRIHFFLVVLGVLSMAMGLGGCGGGASSAPDFSDNGGDGTGNTGSGTGGTTGVVIGEGGNGGAGGAACEPGTPGCTQVLPEGCGDRIVQPELTETCDDGNTLAGDGCNGACQTERNYSCPAEGGPCSPVFRCGNGIVEPGEVCDQGEAQGSPGCSADCTTQDPAYSCLAGSACVRVSVCGDSRVTAGENCDDGNANAGDGCSSSCVLEDGWVCKTPGSACVPGPRCGDSTLNPNLGEVCDDGNTSDGDGCAADCQTKTAGCICNPGQLCTCPVPVCPNGKIESPELCDDGNANSGDGCSSTCQLETGYWCPFPGAPCTFKCGDGVVSSPAEQCDPGVAAMAGACASNCKWNPGWVCAGSPVTCRQTVCGDGTVEGSESCEDGNSNLGDGCTPGCKIEPNCGAGACTSKCGDGIIIAPEICDDGNNLSGDGCAADCSRVEDGYRCSQPEMTRMTVPAVFRDFNSNGQDFEPAITGSNSAVTGMVQGTLVNNKPAFSGTNPQQALANFGTLFNDWYNAGTRSIAVPGQIDLFPNTTGGYVNRWGPNGQQWVGYAQTPAPRWCSNTNGCGTSECVVNAAAGEVCLYPCIPWGTGSTQTCIAVEKRYDGNPTYFPVDGKGFSPPSVSAQARIPPLYMDGNTSWPPEPGGPMHNFTFTSEVRYWFLYDSSKTYQLQFTGDDDVWVFVNRTLAVDLGGIHIPVSGSFSLPTDAARFGLTSGNVYEIALFHAERQTTGSTFMLTLSGFNTSPSVCGPLCGNSIVQPGEQCDNGADNCDPQSSDCYNQCTTSCLLGGYCGDSTTQSAAGEECDNGSNSDVYGANNGCAPECKLPAHCGDGITQSQFGEECDNGSANQDGLYGGCNTSCTLGPYCGDAVVGGPERCDDGRNDGTYGTCGDPNQTLPNCNLPPRCGDGTLQSDWGEECDNGSANCNPRTSTCASDACLISCRLPGGCGDGIKDGGEECDYGSTCPITCNDPAACPTDCNNGAYGGCSPGCVLAPRCGDGIKNGPEQCDDGVNNNSYGTCAPNCKLAPYCGDGIKNGTEECDHGGGDSLCSSQCKNIIYVPT